MSGVPRSQCLIRYQFTGNGYSSYFTCPDGYVVLVKSAYVENAAAESITAKLIAATAVGGAALHIWQADVPTVSSLDWQGWIALNAGDRVQAYLSAGVSAIWVSGAVLSGNAQFPAATRDLPAQQPHR